MRLRSHTWPQVSVGSRQRRREDLDTRPGFRPSESMGRAMDPVTRRVLGPDGDGCPLMNLLVERQTGLDRLGVFWESARSSWEGSARSQTALGLARSLSNLTQWEALLFAHYTSEKVAR
jgi:hypothetical protein